MIPEGIAFCFPFQGRSSSPGPFSFEEKGDFVRHIPLSVKERGIEGERIFSEDR
jgi:hypothetical protein